MIVDIFVKSVHQINALYEVLELKQNFRKDKIATGKTPFFVIGPFCTPYTFFHIEAEIS